MQHFGMTDALSDRLVTIRRALPRWPSCCSVTALSARPSGATALLTLEQTRMGQEAADRLRVDAESVPTSHPLWGSEAQSSAWGDSCEQHRLWGRGHWAKGTQQCKKQKQESTQLSPAQHRGQVDLPIPSWQGHTSKGFSFLLLPRKIPTPSPALFPGLKTNLKSLASPLAQKGSR